MRKGDERRVHHMRSVAHEILELTAAMTRQDFMAHRERILAVSHLFAILGEAASDTGPECRQAVAIDWRAIIGFRNVLIHQYGSVNAAVIYETIRTELPDLVKRLEAALGDA